MANLSQIAKVVISLSTASIKKASFGIPLVVSPTTAFTERVRIYSDPDAAVTDKLGADTLRAVNAAFAQSPRPAYVYVGRRDLGVATISLALTSVTPGNIFSFNFGGESVSYTALADDGIPEVLAGLNTAAAAVSGFSEAFTSKVNANDITLTPKDASKAFALTAGNNVNIASTGSATNVAADLVAINRANKAWYGFCMVEHVDALTLQAAIWAESQTKLFFGLSNSADILDPEVSTDIASQLMRGQYFRTALIVHKDASEYPDAAWMGRCFTIEPGGEVWALKPLSTIQPSDWSDTEQSTIWAKNANTYEEYSDGYYLTNPGKVSGGEWIDIIRSRDFAVDTIQKDVASGMIRAKKIPYTNAGIQTLVNIVRGSMVKLQRAGVLAPDEVNSEGATVPGFSLTYPNAADVDADTKASRKLYLSFVGLLAGAIQVTDITGTLAYSYEAA
ncbi:tail sheath [Xanthomonas phage vB_XveM_DIBBI]|uniref:Tail sheath protein n=1 Tax=Xanthomonas phage vB_XveM_DIBBI TaxID=1129194 RepID=I3PGU9_9CAUD|nr:tail sheath [Xanthomonas phage vB_XveM_DIBBI]AEX65684.1 hypothetical protein DIBBI_016 [Xanthomonas phage vB_XveM_DIBBI]